MLVWDIKHQFARWVDAHRRRDGVTENLILERLDPRAVMAATKRDHIVVHFHRTLR
jgi:hypothetical protein